MSQQNQSVPTQAWVTVFAGMAINLCLGILYAWSIWKAALVDVDKAAAGELMTGINEGWQYLNNAQAATPFSICVIVFALLMIPGGRIQDRISPRFGATLGGLTLAAGCILAGVMKSYTGIIIGFGLLGGIGMGIGYAAPTPAALKWFGPHKRGLIAGIVVGGYGGAALYIGGLGTMAYRQLRNFREFYRSWCFLCRSCYYCRNDAEIPTGGVCCSDPRWGRGGDSRFNSDQLGACRRG